MICQVFPYEMEKMFLDSVLPVLGLVFFINKEYCKSFLWVNHFMQNAINDAEKRFVK